MARLPQPGGDDGSWGSILNDYLAQAHNSDGTLKSNSVTAAQLAPNAVTSTAFNISGGTDGQVLTLDSTKTSGFTWKTASGSVSDATTTTKGVVQLAGDLGGTAAAPTVPGLAGKYAKPAGGIPASDMAASVQTSLTAAGTAVQKINSKTGTNITLTASDVGAASALSQLSDVSSSGAVDGQSLVFNGGTWGPATVAAGSPSVTDATTTTKGVVQLAGDLGGTAAAPTVPGLASKVNTSAVGQANGVASLDGTGKVPSAQLPASTNLVTSVAGRTGDIVLAEADITNLSTDLSAKVAKSTVTTKGDLLAATGSAALARVGVGTDGQVLTASSAAAAGVAWTTPSAGGGSGNGNRTVVKKTADYTASAGDYVICDMSVNNVMINVTLPAPANGAWVSVKKVDSTANAALVKPQAGLIDASASVSVNSQWMDADFISDGTTWYRVG